MWAEQRAWLGELPALTGDAAGFYNRSREPHAFYAAHVREPLFPFLLQFTANHRQARELTGWCSIGLVVILGVLAWRLAGPAAGALAPWLYAGTAFTSYYGVSGLREGLMSFLLLLLVLLLLLDRTWWSRLGCALCAAAIPLLRLEGLLIAPLIVSVWAALKWRRALVLEAVGYTAVAWLAVSPFLLNCRREFGSAFHPMNVHARYWRNHEFAGQPEHLTREEVLADAYGGPPTTSFHYVFGMHTLPEVVGRYARGYWVSLASHIPRILDGRWLFWLWPVGVFWDWKRRWFITLAGIVAQLPFAFILPLNMVMAGRTHPGVEFRFSLPLTPFVVILAAVGIVETIRWWRARTAGTAPHKSHSP